MSNSVGKGRFVLDLLDFHWEMLVTSGITGNQLVTISPGQQE